MKNTVYLKCIAEFYSFEIGKLFKAEIEENLVTIWRDDQSRAILALHSKEENLKLFNYFAFASPEEIVEEVLEKVADKQSQINILLDGFPILNTWDEKVSVYIKKEEKG